MTAQPHAPLSLRKDSSAPFRRLLVANRGEIAIRIFRTCRELGIETVAVHSEADAGAPFVRAADLARCIGPAPPTESYLRGDRLIVVRPAKELPWAPRPGTHDEETADD